MFKEHFKRYKSKKADILDVSAGFSNYFVKQQIATDCYDNFPGLKSPQQWEIYNYKQNPGLIYIKNPFTIPGHRYWPVRCLKYYTHKPNRTNLDIHHPQEINHLIWPKYETERDETLLKKLHWVTLGYHHNWDTKNYSEDEKSPFPSDLMSLTKHFSKVLGFEDFNPQAAIINYYRKNSSLSGHVDHSERNLKAPLFSFSFGQTAIFLIGGTTLDVEPIGLFLRSGDVLVMSEGARMCYHGVPRILQTEEEPWKSNGEFDSDFLSDFDGVVSQEGWENCLDNDFWEPFGIYLKENRINANVRQVLFPGETKLT